MSTHSNIAVYGTADAPLDNFDAIIYKHHDGYPDSEHGMVALLKAMDIERHRDTTLGGADSEGVAAWLLYDLMEHHLKNGGRRHLEFTIGKEVDLCIEYFYALYPGRLEVYKVSWDSPMSAWKKLDEWTHTW